VQVSSCVLFLHCTAITAPLPVLTSPGRKPYDLYEGWKYIRIGDCASALVSDGCQLAIVISAVIVYDQSMASLGVLPTIVTLCLSIVISGIQVVSEQFDHARESSHTEPPVFSRRVYVVTSVATALVSSGLLLAGMISMQWVVGGDVQCSLSQCCQSANIGTCVNCKLCGSHVVRDVERY
jgi:hypothetical protein